MNAFFDPWEAWLGIPLAEQPPDHYRLLGLPRFLPDSTAVDRALSARRTLLAAHATGPHGSEARRMLEECETAASCLLDSRSRLTYDAALRRQLGLSEGPLELSSDAIVAETPAFTFANPHGSSDPAAGGASSLAPGQSGDGVSWSFGGGAPSAAPDAATTTPSPEPAMVEEVEEVSQVVPIEEPVEEAPAAADKPVVTTAGLQVNAGAPVQRPNEALVALWEGAKIVLGGAAGIGAGYLILAFFFPNHSFFGGNGEAPEKEPAKPEVVKNDNPAVRSPTDPVPLPPKITIVDPAKPVPETPQVAPKEVAPSEEESPFRPVEEGPGPPKPPSPLPAPSSEGDPFRVVPLPPATPTPPAVSEEKSGPGVAIPGVGPKLPYRDPKSAPPSVEVTTPSPLPPEIKPSAPPAEPPASGIGGIVDLPPPLGSGLKTLATRAAPASTDTKLDLLTVAALGEGKTFLASAAPNSQPPAWRVMSPKVAGPDASETAVIAQFLMEGRDLQFQWAKSASEMPFRQLKNSLLKIRSGGTTETIPLRSALKAKPIVLAFKDKSQNEELQVGDLPRSDSLHFMVEELTGWPKGARFKGGNRYAKIGSPLVIELEEFPELEITCRLVRRDDDTLGISVVPTYEDSPSTKLDFTAQRMNNLKAATEQGLEQAKAELPQLARDGKILQAKLVDANIMPARNGIEINQKRQAIEKLTSMIQVAARRYQSLEKRIPVLEKRLEAMPKLEIAMNSMAGEATIRYRIVAALDADELVLVDARQ